MLDYEVSQNPKAGRGDIDGLSKPATWVKGKEKTVNNNTYWEKQKMGKRISRPAVKNRSYFYIMFSVIFAFPFMATAADENAGPLCRYKDLDNGNIVVYRCDRFQSKGDLDSNTPQLKIVDPKPGDVIDYSNLPDGNNNGKPELPIRIVVSPEADYKVDFTAASNAGTQYAMLPQVDGLGHAHAYIAPEIEVTQDNGGNITGVTFVGSDNRSDKVGGFCVFQTPVLQTPTYQVLTVNCELQQTSEPISAGKKYRVIVDTTENSHGPRIKNHPRDVPPGDQVVIEFTNVPGPQ